MYINLHTCSSFDSRVITLEKIYLICAFRDAIIIQLYIDVCVIVMMFMIHTLPFLVTVQRHSTNESREVVV